MTDFVLALTTLPGDFDAAAFAEDLVSARLAACVSIQPRIRSVYTWEGAVQSDEEQQLVIKTTAAQVEGLWARLKTLHPYDVPEFIVVPILSGSEAYLGWVRESVTS